MTPHSREIVQIGTGAAMVCALGLFFVYQYSFGRQVDAGGYDLIARFDRVDGLVVGSEVYAAGIQVGRVTRMDLDENKRAVLTLEVDRRVELDSDATASVATDGLLGSKFVQLNIGGGEETIEPGGEITYTESTVILDDLLDLIIAQARRNQARLKDLE